MAHSKVLTVLQEEHSKIILEIMTKLNTMSDRVESMGAKRNRGMHRLVDAMKFSNLVHDYMMDFMRAQSFISHMS